MADRSEPLGAVHDDRTLPPLVAAAEVTFPTRSCPGTTTANFVSRYSARTKGMTGYKRNVLRISAMEKEVTAKLALAQQLEREHSRLQAEHQLLVACCDSLQLLRLQHGEAEHIHEEELALLKQLQNIPYSLPTTNGSNSPACSASPQLVSMPCSVCSAHSQQPSASGAAVGAVAEPAEDASDWIAPPNDRMAYFRYILSLPPFPGAEDITVEQLVADYASTVHSLSLQLHLLNRPAEHQEELGLLPAQKIKMLIDRHLHLMSTLVLSQRSELMEAFMLVNFETFTPAEEHRMEKHTWLVNESVAISPEQRANVSNGMDLFGRVLAPILAERMQVQQQIAAEHVPVGISRQQWLDEQGKRLERLSLLLKKEYLARMAAAAWIVGCFTYSQLAIMVVQMTPNPVCLSMLGKVLQHKQEQAQHHQKQQRPTQKQTRRK